MNNMKMQAVPVASESFVIDVVDLVQPNARRPHHLDSRLRAKKRPSPSSTAERKVEAKRQALLEARRLKLSQQLNRVRQVVSRQRQRAASTLSDKQLHIVQSLEAAEKNRNELIKAQVDQCAAKVEKAKKIALANHQRSAEQQSKMRMELDHRQWNTDFRRHLLQKLPRSKLLDGSAVELEWLFANGSAKRLQRWWRQVKFAPLVDAFLTTGMDKAAEMPFETLMVKIQNPHIIETTSQLLVHVKKASHHGRGKTYKNPTKIFLSSYMIVYHTAEIMPEVGAEEAAIKAAAEVMLKQFQEWLVMKSFTAFSDFSKSWDVYHRLFDQWKKRDTERLLSSLTEHFMQLERLWDSVKGQVDAETEWRPRIETEQKQIKNRVVRLGGKSALKRLLTNQQEFRDASESESESVEGTPAMKRLEVESVVNSPYQSQTEGRQEEASASASSAKPVAASEMNKLLASFGAGLTNEQLAHELVLDPEFELKPNKNDQSFESQVRAIAKKAFFDKMRQDVTENKYDSLAAVLADIKQQLLEMAPEKSKIHAEIKEALDVELIMQQVQVGAIDMPRYSQFITEKMLQLCAPVRDAEIRKIAEIKDVVGVFQAILDSLEGMHLDLANFRLRALRPHLMQQAVEYERGKFDAALAAGTISLDKTSAWLTSSVKSVQEVAAARNPENISIPENRIRFDAVYFDALMALLFSTEPISRETCPETLLLDAERLFGVQNEQQAITVVAALIMLTRNFVAEIRDDREAIQQLKDGLFVLLQDGKTTIEHLTAHIVSSVNVVLARHKKSLTEEQTSMVRTMVDKTLSYKDTVYSLLNRRLASMVRVQLASGRFRRDSNTGMEAVQAEIEALSRKIFLLANHNRQVFAARYDEIIRAAL